MSDPAPDYEEMAALHALGLLEPQETRQLLEAAESDPAVRALLVSFQHTAAQLAGDAPVILPPPALRGTILRALPAAADNVLQFSRWFPYAIAACLMVIGVTEAMQIFHLTAERRALQAQLADADTTTANLRASNALSDLRIAELDTKNPAYATARVLVAWDALQHRGALALQNLPAAPAGQDYQLWVLDPNAAVPVSAGLLTSARTFQVPPVSVPNPGFAISLEPAGGSKSPTGPILFAVAPAE